MAYETFHYSTLEDVKRTASEMNAFLPHSEDVSPLYKPLALGAKTAPNRIAFQPMEGTDGTETGAPGALTIRRYERFAKAGPGLIWFEAVATVPQGRASAHQLYLREDNLDEFKRLTDDIRETCLRENGYVPVLVMQATNSGRYSKPTGAPDPMIAYNCPPLEDTPLPASRILSDEQLRRFEEAFGVTARLSQQAGFDGMDVKCCHRYLACELLSAYTRPGEYGGSYENRTRFLKNAYRAAKAAITGDFFLTSRLNAYDGFPNPYGFGVHGVFHSAHQHHYRQPLQEPARQPPVRSRQLRAGRASLRGRKPHDARRERNSARPARSARHRQRVFVSAPVLGESGRRDGRRRPLRDGRLRPHGVRRSELRTGSAPHRLRG